MIKLLFLLFFFLHIKAERQHDIEIAIMGGDAVKLNSLLRKTIPIIDKNKYVELSRNMTLKYAEPMNAHKYKKAIHFSVGGISILMFLQQMIEVKKEVGELDDMRKKIVVFGMAKAAILLGFGIVKLQHTYNFYHKNKKYTAALRIEEIVNEIHTDADIVRKIE